MSENPYAAFRSEIPEAQAVGEPVFAMAVRMLASQLKGGKAEEMASFLRLALHAVQTNGYGITYVVGPRGEFGLMVCPENPDSRSPQLDADSTDYALWCELGGVTQLRETLDIATARDQHRNCGNCRGYRNIEIYHPSTDAIIGHQPCPEYVPVPPDETEEPPF